MSRFKQLLLRLKHDKYLVGLIIVCLIFAGFWLYMFSSYSTQWAQDSHWHLTLIENFASGNGYTLDGVNPHAKYPPGLALTIMPLYLILGNVDLAGLITLFILSIASLVLCYKIGKLVNKKVAIIATVLLATHNLFIFNSFSIMTEIPFMFFSILSLYLFTLSFDKRIYVIPSFIAAALSILIRYDGLFLIFPFAFYLFIKRKDFDNFFFNTKTFIAIGTSIAFLSLWFTRNFIQFGSFLYTDYSKEIVPFQLIFIWQFFSLFFKIGYLLPILSIIGLVITIKIIKNQKLNIFIVWFATYFFLHCWWYFKVLRFYVGVLLLLGIFAAIAIDYLSKKVNGVQWSKILTIVLVVIVVISQLGIFYAGTTKYETTIKTLNRYDVIRDVSEYANENLPADSNYLIPETIVYPRYLKKQNIYFYNQIVQLVSNPPANTSTYILIDNLHPWTTQAFFPINNSISIPLTDKVGNPITLKLTIEELITEHHYSYNATILNVTSYELFYR